MRCPYCGSSNPRGNRFCGSCGQPLLVRVASVRPNRGVGGRRAVFIGAIVIGLIWAAESWGASQHGPPSTAAPMATVAPVATETVEPTVVPVATPAPSQQYMLAVIQSGQSLSQDDPLVGEFQQALLNLKTMCHANGKQLAGMDVITHDDMAKRGVEESYLSILQHVYDSSLPVVERVGTQPSG